MKILHYLSGLPPVRGGGMIQYALDLVEAENAEHEVFLLIPGTISWNKNRRFKVVIKSAKHWHQVPIYRINNPLPIPMGNGILDIVWYTQQCDATVYYEFLQKLCPDIVHIHTFMGLHEEFLQTAMGLGIPIIYTTHDYFGLCPTANMMCKNQICHYVGKYCRECSQNAFTEKRLVIEQSKLYTLYRKNPLLLKALHSKIMRNVLCDMRSTSQNSATKDALSIKSSSVADYNKLLLYYRRMFEMITFFHFNSNQSCRIFKSYLGDIQGMVIPVCRSMQDHRKKRVPHKELQIGFLGGKAAFKGEDCIRQSIRELHEEGLTDIVLHTYGISEQSSDAFCRNHAFYTSDELGQVFDQIDILAVPSHWPETFGMVVWEALSFGVPVIMTNNVGAKDLLAYTTKPIGIVVEDTVSAFKAAIRDCYMHREKLVELNNNILQADIKFDYYEHVRQICQMYGRCIA